MNAQVGFYSYEGELLKDELVKIPARGQVHLGANGVLGQGALGIARIRSAKPGALVVSSMNYYRVRLKAWGGVDLGLHDEARYGIGVNKLGMLEVRDSVPGGVFAQVVRVKPLEGRGLDSLMATRVR